MKFYLSLPIFLLRVLGTHSKKCKTVAEIACGGGLDMLCNAIREAELYDALDDNNSDLTAFAPTDGAFEKLLHDLDLESGDIRDIGREALREVLLLHIPHGHNGSGLSKRDLKRHCSDLLRMESGEFSSTICKDGKRDIYQKGPGNSDREKPKIIEFDVEACNGIVHVVDEVLLPKHIDLDIDPKRCKSITDLVCGSGNFGSDVLCGALRFAGLDHSLGDHDGSSWNLYAPNDERLIILMHYLSLKWFY